jgi:hypothetical protein
MKNLYILLLFIYSCYCFGSNKNDYEIHFKDEIEEANIFIKKSHFLIEKSSKKYTHNNIVTLSIIYPELLRYNYLKDFFETSSLEIMYVNFGAKAADFSIGQFQMKPSFAEKIENYIYNKANLKVKYKKLIGIKLFSQKYARQLRIKRLKNTAWQLVYLHAFIDVCFHKFTPLKHELEINQVKFLATCYNNGIQFSFIELNKRSQLKIFPYGKSYNGHQFCYASIAQAYYIKTKKKAYDKIILNF